MYAIHRLACLALIFPAAAIAGPRDSTLAGSSYQGESVTADLPASLQMKNIGSRIDGKGMCVFTAFEMMCRYHGLSEFIGFRDWCAQNYRGGGYPAKLDKLIAAYCQAKGITPPVYVQYEGSSGDTLLKLVDRRGGMACDTYGYGPRYREPIAHMTNVVKFGDRWAVNLDNNFPQTAADPNALEWMAPAELMNRINSGGGGWVVALAAPGPPPIPKNAGTSTPKPAAEVLEVIGWTPSRPFVTRPLADVHARFLRSRGLICRIEFEGIRRWVVYSRIP